MLCVYYNCMQNIHWSSVTYIRNLQGNRICNASSLLHLGLDLGQSINAEVLRLWHIFNAYDLVVRAPAQYELDVHFALYVHEDQPPSEADGHHNQLGPEGPVKVAVGYLLCGAVNQHVKWPDDAGDGNDVKSYRADDLPPLCCGHVQSLPLQTQETIWSLRHNCAYFTLDSPVFLELSPDCKLSQPTGLFFFFFLGGVFFCLYALLSQLRSASLKEIWATSPKERQLYLPSRSTQSSKPKHWGTLVAFLQNSARTFFLSLLFCCCGLMTD